MLINWEHWILAIYWDLGRYNLVKNRGPYTLLGFFNILRKISKAVWNCELEWLRISVRQNSSRSSSDQVLKNWRVLLTQIPRYDCLSTAGFSDGRSQIWHIWVDFGSSWEIWPWLPVLGVGAEFSFLFKVTFIKYLLAVDALLAETSSLHKHENLSLCCAIQLSPNSTSTHPLVSFPSPIFYSMTAERINPWFPTKVSYDSTWAFFYASSFSSIYQTLYLDIWF